MNSDAVLELIELRKNFGEKNELLFLHTWLQGKPI